MCLPAVADPLSKEVLLPAEELEVPLCDDEVAVDLPLVTAEVLETDEAEVGDTSLTLPLAAARAEETLAAEAESSLSEGPV